MNKHLSCPHCYWWVSYQGETGHQLAYRQLEDHVHDAHVEKWQDVVSDAYLTN